MRNQETTEMGDPLQSQTEGLIAGETHIEIDARAVCRSDERDKCARRFKVFRFFALGVFLVGLFAVFVTCTAGWVRQPIAATDKTVGFAIKHDCKDGDPCSLAAKKNKHEGNEKEKGTSKKKDDKEKEKKENDNEEEDDKDKKNNDDDEDKKKDEDEEEDDKDEKKEEADEDEEEDDTGGKGKEKDDKKDKSKKHATKGKSKKNKKDEGKDKGKGNKCAATWEGCLEAKCCESAGMQCYSKDSYWAVCKGMCTKGKNPDTHESWTCTEVGKRDWTHALPPHSKKNGYPSLFCFTYITTKGPQVDLLKGQLERQLGIFACDGFAVVADKEISLGKLPYKGVWGNIEDPVRTIKLDNGAAKGAELVSSVWDVVTHDGKYQSHDWTVRVQPDTVLLPGRLRVHLKEKTFQDASQYVQNCEKKEKVKGRKLNEKEKKEDKDKKDKEEDEEKDKKDKEEEKPAGKEKHEEKVEKDEKEKKNKKDRDDKEEKKDEKDKKDKKKGDDDDDKKSEKHEKEGKKDKKDKKAKKDESKDEDEEESTLVMMDSLEIISVDAAKLYSENGKGCKKQAKWKNWHADQFMTKCMDHLAVSAVELVDTLMDAKCKGINCADPWAPAFRNNFHTKESWMACWQKAIR